MMWILPWWGWIVVVIEMVLIILTFTKWREPMLVGVKPREDDD